MGTRWVNVLSSIDTSIWAGKTASQLNFSLSLGSSFSLKQIMGIQAWWLCVHEECIRTHESSMPVRLASPVSMPPTPGSAWGLLWPPPRHQHWTWPSFLISIRLMAASGYLLIEIRISQITKGYASLYRSLAFCVFSSMSSLFLFFAVFLLGHLLSPSLWIMDMIFGSDWAVAGSPPNVLAARPFVSFVGKKKGVSQCKQVHQLFLFLFFPCGLYFWCFV